MALTNIFENVATENTLIDLVRANQRGSNRSARTIANADRVNVENVVTAYNYRSYLWDAGSYATWWASHSTNNVDSRQQLLETTRTNAIFYRQRWSFT